MGGGNQTGWHAVNLFLLLVSSIFVYIFLGRFLKPGKGVFTGTALFMFSFPMAVAVARVSWRTTILALIPFLISMILISVWSAGTKTKWLPAAVALFYLVSLLVKETAVAALPVMAVAAYSSSAQSLKWKNTLRAIAIGGIPLVIYGALRYRAMGFGVNYTESTSFGLFMAKNLVLQNAVVWQPWLSGVSARLLFLLYPVAVYFVVPEWKNKVLVVSMGVFLMLPVSNLTVRPDFSVAALPGAALFLGFLVQRLSGNKYFIPMIGVFFTGIILFSGDEVKTLKAASDYVEKTTQRLAVIADELPGDGPLFIEGIDKTIGAYGTFWPGEYMIPLQCSGIQPGRFVTGTDRMWETLIAEGSGFMVFVDNDGIGYKSVPVSVDMYKELPDTVVALSGATLAGDLVLYPSCTGPEESFSLFLVSPLYPDSVVTVVPEVVNGHAVYDLASVPVWLCSNPELVISVENSADLVFSSRNVALENAINSLDARSRIQ